MDMDPLTSLHVCKLNRFSHVWLCATLWTLAPQAPLSMEFSRQEYWNGLPWSPPGALPHPGIEPVSLMSPALADGFFTASATWEARVASLSSSFMQIIWSKENFLLECYYLTLMRAEIFECGSNAASSQRPHVQRLQQPPSSSSILSFIFLITDGCYLFQMLHIFKMHWPLLRE